MKFLALFFIISIGLTNAENLCNRIPGKKHLNCVPEIKNQQNLQPLQNNQLTFLEWNVDRNGYGGDGYREEGIEKIISVLHNQVPQADVYFFSELTRGCKQWGNGMNGLQEIANSYNYSWTYFVEFVEENTFNKNYECSIGNGIMSRFPLNDVQGYEYSTQCCYYGNRLRGRSYVKAVINVQDKEYTLYSTHLESGIDKNDELRAEWTRRDQMKELFSDMPENAIFSGDFNDPFVDLYLIGVLFREKRILYDAQEEHIRLYDRGTTNDVEFKYEIPILDYILGTSRFSSAGIGNKASDEVWSDHFVIWAAMPIAGK